MTDEERRKLCEIFRDNTTTIHPHHLKEAADEIERLAEDVRYWKIIANRAYIDPKPLAQSDAEPVAWPDIDAAVKAGLAWRNPAPNAAVGLTPSKMVTISAPTTPPRPDASAGLIEAAKMAEEEEKAGWAVGSFVLRDFAIKLRARAADRSEKSKGENRNA